MEEACTSLTFSPTGEFLATTHVDYLGIFLWSNRTVYSHVSLRPIPETSEAPMMVLPGAAHETEQEKEPEDESSSASTFISPQQLDAATGLITLSGLALSRWQNLLNIDVVKKRNKPRAPPRKPKLAPFFLPTIPSLSLTFDFSDVEKDGQSKMLIPTGFTNLSVFGKLLLESGNDFNAAIEQIKSFGPVTIDFEIKNFAPDDGGSIQVMLQFFKMIESMFQRNQDFELAQSYLSLFLKTHSSLIAHDEILSGFLINIQQAQSTSWNKLQEQLLSAVCIVNALRSK